MTQLSPMFSLILMHINKRINKIIFFWPPFMHSVHGLALKQGEEFAHSFNVKQIKCIEAKLTKVTQDMEALENIKGTYDIIFKGILK